MNDTLFFTGKPTGQAPAPKSCPRCDLTIYASIVVHSVRYERIEDGQIVSCEYDVDCPLCQGDGERIYAANARLAELYEQLRDAPTPELIAHCRNILEGIVGMWNFRFKQLLNQCF